MSDSGGGGYLQRTGGPFAQLGHYLWDRLAKNWNDLRTFLRQRELVMDYPKLALTGGDDSDWPSPLAFAARSLFLAPSFVGLISWLLSLFLSAKPDPAAKFISIVQFFFIPTVLALGAFYFSQLARFRGPNTDQVQKKAAALYLYTFIACQFWVNFLYAIWLGVDTISDTYFDTQIMREEWLFGSLVILGYIFQGAALIWGAIAGRYAAQLMWEPLGFTKAQSEAGFYKGISKIYIDLGIANFLALLTIQAGVFVLAIIFALVAVSIRWG